MNKRLSIFLVFFLHTLLISLVFFIASALAKEGYKQELLVFGKFKSRAIYTHLKSKKCSAPLVILVPGSGVNGPEGVMPGAFTADGKDQKILSDFAKGLQAAYVNTLAIGKPGVDFYSERKVQHYNLKLYNSLSWQDLITNVHEALEFAKTLPCVDPNRISILGHSEGSQVVVDFVTMYPNSVKALILVGYAGEGLESIVDWQLFRRAIDTWLALDVDLNQDGFITKTEAKLWPDFVWKWKPKQNQVSFDEIEKTLRESHELEAEYKKLSNLKIWKGVFNRQPLYAQTAELSQDLYVYTGSDDVQVKPEFVINLKKACEHRKKKNCYTYIVPGLGHAMSPPKGHRKQRYLDSTLGPVDKSFLEILKKTAQKF